eukprot:m.67497 g.67497  ORF g.67497 m.67497 type:complete len:845 (+) comp8217_c0_seq4:170-2704(+)
MSYGNMPVLNDVVEEHEIALALVKALRGELGQMQGEASPKDRHQEYHMSLSRNQEQPSINISSSWKKQPNSTRNSRGNHVLGNISEELQMRDIGIREEDDFGDNDGNKNGKEEYREEDACDALTSPHPLPRLEMQHFRHGTASNRSSILRNNSKKENTEEFLEGAIALLNRLQFDLGITIQKFKYWFQEQAARKRELDDFNEFKIKQISDAVKSEAFKNLREIKEKKQDITLLQMTLSKVRDRVSSLEAERRGLAAQLQRSTSLKSVVEQRIKREAELIEPIQEELKREQEDLKVALQLNEKVNEEWKTLLAHSTTSQQEHALMKKKKSYSVDRAIQLLKEEESVSPPEDVSGELRQNIKQSMFLQKELQDKLATLEQEKSMALIKVDQFQRQLLDARAVVKAKGEKLVMFMNENVRRRHDMDKLEISTRNQLNDAQNSMLMKKEEVMQKDDALIVERRKLEKIKNAITSAKVNKQSREAEMQRIADQYDVAMAEHNQISRELRHMEKQMNAEADTLMMDEKSAQHESRVMDKKLTSEEAWRFDIENALKDVREKLHVMRTERDRILPRLESDADREASRRNELDTKSTSLEHRLKELLQEQVMWEESYAALQKVIEKDTRADMEKEASLSFQEKKMLQVVLSLEEDLSHAPEREVAERKKIADKIDAIEESIEKVESLMRDILHKEEEVAFVRTEIKQIKQETANMIEEDIQALEDIETAGVEHAQHVEQRKQEIKERKLRTKRIVARNEPGVKRFKELQRESLELRTHLVIVLQEELEKSIMNQRQEEIEAYHVRFANSDSVFWKAEQIDHQIKDCLKKKAKSIGIVDEILNSFSGKDPSKA